MIRIFKNARSSVDSKGLLSGGTAPSYFIEGLLYNVPDRRFSGTLTDTFTGCFNFLNSEVDRGKMVCVNERYHLLWEGVATSWPAANCELFLNAVAALWNRWGTF